MPFTCYPQKYLEIVKEARQNGANEAEAQKEVEKVIQIEKEMKAAFRDLMDENEKSFSGGPTAKDLARMLGSLTSLESEKNNPESK